MPAPRGFLKLYTPDSLKGESLPLFYHQMTSQLLQEGLPDTLDTEKIVGHEVDKKGNVTYLVKWKGYDEITREPPDNFVTYVNQDWVRYNTQKNLWGLKGAHPSFKSMV